MPEAKLWLLNHSGQAFTLDSSKRQFSQLANTLDDAITVKRITASHWCAWAIGHDHRVYIYVQHAEVPIRVSEIAYENQVKKQGFLMLYYRHTGHIWGFSI